MTKPKYTPEERKRIMGENMLKNKAKAASNGYTQKSASRELAIAEGKKTYTGNTSCKNCGSFEKYVSSYNCVSCAVKTGLEKLNNEELMKPYRTKEKKQKYCEDNKEKVNGIKRKYAKTERGKAIGCEKSRRYSARKQLGIPVDITEQQLRQIQEVYQQAQHLTFTTGVQYDVDHIIPLFEGGLHHSNNLQVITHEEHLMKTAQENSRRQQK
jgi:5-methylcytosine-specific restriction endonuclease McrA